MMKNFLKLALFVVFALGAAAAMGQNVKLGYINSQELIQVMPEIETASGQLEEYTNELSEQIEALQVELNNKFQQYQKDVSTYSEAIRSLKEKELNDLSTRIEESRQVVQQDLQRMQYELMAPIFEKADEAIKKVAQANSITAVFDSAQGAILYFDESSMTDLLPLVKAELGIN